MTGSISEINNPDFKMAPMKRSAEDPAGQLVLVPQKKQRNEMMIVNNASR